MTKAWNDNKDEIIKLYINEGRTLQDVMVIMSQKHGFMASTRSYRQHFDHWRVGKYNCKRRQKRRQTYPQPNLPSPPGTPPMPLPQLNPSDGGSSPDSASEAIHGGIARGDVHYPFLKQESLQAYGMQNLPVPFRNGSGQQFIKAETSVAQTSQSKERSTLNMNCWNASDRPPAEWTQRAYFSQKRDHMGPLGDIPRYSPEDASFNVNTGQISPTWHDQQSPMSDDMDWSLSKQRAPSHYTMSPPLSQHQGQQLHEPDHKPLQPPVFHSGQASFVHGTARPQASPVDRPSVANEPDRKPLQAPAFHPNQAAFVHSTAHPHPRRQASVVDHASAALELRNKQQPCIDRTAVHQAANFQLELA